MAGSAGVVVAASQFPFARARTAPVRFVGYPFTLGVASGDPQPDGVVLWTRLAPSPLSGNGGMPDKPVTGRSGRSPPTRTSRASSRAARRSRSRSDAHSVHAEPRGLQPGREYFYRFRANGEISPTGRTKTAPAGAASALAFAFASLPAVRARLLHRLQAHGAGRPRPGHPPRRLHLRVRHELVHGDRRQRARELQPRDRQPRRLPRAPRAVQDRPGPAGRARRVPVAGHLRRPRDRQQLGLRHARGRPAAGRLLPPPQGRVQGLLGAHAAAQGPEARRGTASRSTSAAATATWPRST